MFFYLASPMNSPLTCQLLWSVINLIIFHGMLLFDAIIIVKYIFIFHLKNPTALQEDFWKIFVNCWIFIFNFVVQIPYHMIPGKEQTSVSLCIGSIPLQYINDHPKKPFVSLTVTIISTLLHLSFWILTFILKRWRSQRYIEYQSFELKWSNIVNKENIHIYAIHFVCGLYSLYVYIFVKSFNIIDPSQIEIYPNYIFIYLQDNIMAPSWIIIILIMFLRGNKRLRRDVSQELKVMFKLN